MKQSALFGCLLIAIVLTLSLSESAFSSRDQIQETDTTLSAGDQLSRGGGTSAPSSGISEDLLAFASGASDEDVWGEDAWDQDADDAEAARAEAAATAEAAEAEANALPPPSPTTEADIAEWHAADDWNTGSSGGNEEEVDLSDDGWDDDPADAHLDELDAWYEATTGPFAGDDPAAPSSTENVIEGHLDGGGDFASSTDSTTGLTTTSQGGTVTVTDAEGNVVSQTPAN